MIVLKRYRPTSPGIRGLVSVKNSNLYIGKSYKKLTTFKKCSSGRNNLGKITVWGRGGGHKRMFRVIDFIRNKYDILSKVERIEYDPNRSSYIALLLYEDGDRKYILATTGLKVGDFVISGKSVPIKDGNALPLRNIPLGTNVNCIELYPRCGAIFARGAGCYAQLLAKDFKHATLRLRSGEIRKVPLDCFASIGILSKSEHNLIKDGKAGRSRWKNIRPNVRGVAMNPVDHPLGGGEGKTSGGRPACSPWGIPEGKITRKSKKYGYKLVLKRRKK